LFAELERTPRNSNKFKEGSRRLADMLGLAAERFCSGVDVLDRSRRSCWPEGSPACDDWNRVHSVRLDLLAAVERATQ
jgi:hypothetical protein